MGWVGGGVRVGGGVMYLHGTLGMLPLQTINALFEVLGGLQNIYLLLPLCYHSLIQTLHAHWQLCRDKNTTCVTCFPAERGCATCHKCAADRPFMTVDECKTCFQGYLDMDHHSHLTMLVDTLIRQYVLFTASASCFFTQEAYIA